MYTSSAETLPSATLKVEAAAARSSEQARAKEPRVPPWLPRHGAAANRRVLNALQRRHYARMLLMFYIRTAAPRRHTDVNMAGILLTSLKEPVGFG